MPLKSKTYVMLLSIVAVLPSCVSTSLLTPPIVLNHETARLEGWLSTRGEWTLFLSPEFRKYNPYVEESKKCVSLVNATGSPRSKYQNLHGKKVVLIGSSVRYEDLPTGESDSDRLLSKRYFKTDPVENFCLRDSVFAVTAIERD